MNAQFIFSLMDEAAIKVIRTWRYEGTYAVYNMGSDGDDDMTELLDRRSPYYVVRNGQDEIIGFLNVGTSALVWGSSELSIYIEKRTIAIGLGMRPDATGKGMGLAFVQACLDFARREFAPEHFRLYVLPWNERAIHVYERAGFRRVGVYVQRGVHGEREFLEMSRACEQA